MLTTMLYILFPHFGDYIKNSFYLFNFVSHLLANTLHSFYNLYFLILSKGDHLKSLRVVVIFLAFGIDRSEIVQYTKIDTR